MPQGGLAQMVAQQGGSRDVVEAAQEIESMPGGSELLYTTAAEAMMKAQGVPSKKAQKIRLYCLGGSVKAARGGSTKAAAERTRQAGQGDDEMLVHMTPNELDIIKGMWGDPETNPDTGLPQYGFFKKAWKKVKGAVKKVVKSPVFQVVAPLALSVFAPGIGTAIGAKLGLSGQMASIAGDAIVRGGLGAITGGKKGAITGAVSGAVSGGLGKVVGERLGLEGKIADTVGSALTKGLGSAATGEGFAPGAVSGGLEAFMQTRPEQLAAGIRGDAGPLSGFRETYTGLAPGEQGPALPPLSGALNVAKKYAPLAMTLAPALMGGAGGGDGGGGGGRPPGGGDFDDSGFGESMPLYTMNRQFQGLPSDQDYYTYGQPGSAYSGQHLFINPPDPFPLQPPPDATGAPVGDVGGLGAVAQQNEAQLRNQMYGDYSGMTEANRPRFQQGGEFDYWDQNEDVPNAAPAVSARGRYVKGPGSGRSDDIEARLSDGEYVMDAETVALLGDGSSDQGAKALDTMRANLRKHKGKNLSRGKFSHKAKQPQQYMNNGGRVKRKYEHGGVHNV